MALKFIEAQLSCTRARRKGHAPVRDGRIWVCRGCEGPQLGRRPHLAVLQHCPKIEKLYHLTTTIEWLGEGYWSLADHWRRYRWRSFLAERMVTIQVIFLLL